MAPARDHAPYEEADVDATVSELMLLDGDTVTGEELLAREVATTHRRVR